MVIIKEDDGAPLNQSTGFLMVGQRQVRLIAGNLWTSLQRRSNSIHEISYRACFKAELPRFFISKYTRKNDVVYDPFMGRGTTPVETSLNERIPMGIDISPLSEVFTRPRLNIPRESDILERVSNIPLDISSQGDIDLSMFFHRDTEGEIMSLRTYLSERKESGEEDRCDEFIRMVATNRLTGHSSGFFSVYTLPPNQAASPESQIRINKKLGQVPPYRNVKELTVKKIRSLLRNVDESTRAKVNRYGVSGRLHTMNARDTSDIIPPESVNLTVTSPPFMNTVQYMEDNWMRLWFNGITIDDSKMAPFVTANLSKWKLFIGDVFEDLYRITKPGGCVAFEVGEIKKGELNLEEYVAEIGSSKGFDLEVVYINAQSFSKTSNIWGVKNNTLGTNTNRIVVFRKE